jgi:hypothetical protein
MIRVFWTDKNGVKKCSLLRDGDDRSRPEKGIPLELPPIEEILDEAKPEIRNSLIEAGIFTWADVEANPNVLDLVVRQFVHRRLVNEYRRRT